jgi:hypothetical protein
MESLKRAGYEWSPECVVCHVVGYGAEDGYVSAQETPHLACVGCEACHGRGKVLRRGGCGRLVRSVGPETCRTCHTQKHHPNFRFETLWKKIEH